MKLFGKNEVDVSKEMTLRMKEATNDSAGLSNLLCPSCAQLKLRTISVERGKVGWETKFFCDACKTAGVLNHTGFHVELLRAEKK